MNLPSPDGVQILLTLGSLAVAIVALRKVIVPTWKGARRGWAKFTGFVEAIAGRDPILDKATGKELAPAVPPLGNRLSGIEDTMLRLVTVIESNQDAHKRIDGLETRVDGVETTVGALIGGTFERGAHDALAAVKQKNADAIDAEEVTP